MMMVNNANTSSDDDIALTTTQRETLAAVLNLIIAPSDDGCFPGAAQFDVWGYVCDSAKSLAALVRNELDRLDADSLSQTGEAFATLEQSTQQALVDRIRGSESGFMNDLARHTVEFYYQQDCVLLAIGMEARPPFPLGYQVEAGDLSLLEPVRARGRIYREV